jgi:pyruvate dehydrogenase E1 component alpha subunit/2-oxoisovalerate dehydrogenase E1 component alpha subunit
MSPVDPRDEEPDIRLARVLREDGTADPASDPHLSLDLLFRAYREMRQWRLLDERLLAMQRQGRIGFYGSSRGQEAIPIAAGLALDENDWVFPALREQAIMLLRGFPLRSFVAQLFGNSADRLKGRQMPCHQSARSVGHVSWSSCVGTQAPHAVGAAWSMRARKTGAVAMGFVGDGATSQGDFHAAMNFAAVWRVPCVLVCQNNQWSISLPVDRQTASPTLAIKARAYGMPGIRVDGNDFLAVHAVLRSAVQRARDGEGPTFVEAVTYRMGPHSSSDDPSRYRTSAEESVWASRDPLARLRFHLAHFGRVSDDLDAAIDREFAVRLAAAIDEVEPLPGTPVESLLDDVYAVMPWHLREQLEELKRNEARRRNGDRS